MRVFEGRDLASAHLSLLSPLVLPQFEQTLLFPPKIWSSVSRNLLLRIVATVSARFPELGPDVGVGEGPRVADSVVEVVRVFLFFRQSSNISSPCKYVLMLDEQFTTFKM